MMTTQRDDRQYPRFSEPFEDRPLDPQAMVARARQLQAETFARLVRRAAAGLRGVVEEYLVAPVVRWHLRNQLYRELTGLDDHSLADIGISRQAIPEIVRNAFPRRAPASQEAPAELAVAGEAQVHRLPVGRGRPAAAEAADADRPRAA